MEELKEFWKDVSINGERIIIKNIYPPDEVMSSVAKNTSPASEYEQVKEFLALNSKERVNDASNRIVRDNFRFFNSHLVKRRNFLYFRKCEDKTCAHCLANNPVESKIKETLKHFGSTLPYPLQMNNSTHYFKLLSLLENNESKEQYKKGIGQLKLDVCTKKGCNWTFMNNRIKKKTHAIHS